MSEDGRSEDPAVEDRRRGRRLDPPLPPLRRGGNALPHLRAAHAVLQGADRGEADGDPVRQSRMSRSAGATASSWLPPRADCPDCHQPMVWKEITDPRGYIYAYTYVERGGTGLEIACPYYQIDVKIDGVCTIVKSYLVGPGPDQDRRQGEGPLPDGSRRHAHLPRPLLGAGIRSSGREIADSNSAGRKKTPPETCPGACCRPGRARPDLNSSYFLAAGALTFVQSTFPSLPMAPLTVFPKSFRSFGPSFFGILST